MKHLTKIRVLVWEFEWITEVEETIVHPDIQGRYFYSPQGHHQGMFMVLTREQLIAWKTRGSLCLFDKPTRRFVFHQERTSGAMDLCNVTQLQFCTDTHPPTMFVLSNYISILHSHIYYLFLESIRPSGY